MADVVIDARFPIGRFAAPAAHSEAERATWISDIGVAPARLRAAVAGWSPEQLDTPYREGGWTVRQVVHHLGDSHMNAFVRFKLGLTEAEPEIKTYREELWAELPDTAATPIESSLSLVESLHARWVALLRGMSAEDFDRAVRHPEWPVPPRLFQLLAMYSWHGRHHVAHITSLASRMGW
jgi:uncharacterized damage-inducible protein DinB